MSSEGWLVGCGVAYGTRYGDEEVEVIEEETLSGMEVWFVG